MWLAGHVDAELGEESSSRLFFPLEPREFSNTSCPLTPEQGGKPVWGADAPGTETLRGGSNEAGRWTAGGRVVAGITAALLERPLSPSHGSAERGPETAKAAPTREVRKTSPGAGGGDKRPLPLCIAQKGVRFSQGTWEDERASGK